MEIHAIKVANHIIGEEFFVTTRNTRNILQVQDSRGKVVLEQLTYDSPTIAFLLDYWNKNKATN